MAEEIKEGENAVSLLGGKIVKAEEFTIPDNSNRTIVVIQKQRFTIYKYPRQGVKIKNKPL